MDPRERSGIQETMRPERGRLIKHLHHLPHALLPWTLKTWTAPSLLFMSTVSAAANMWPVTFIFNWRVCVCEPAYSYITSVSAFCHCTPGLQRMELFLTTLLYKQAFNHWAVQWHHISISSTLLTDSQTKVTNARKNIECLFAMFTEW